MFRPLPKWFRDTCLESPMPVSISGISQRDTWPDPQQGIGTLRSRSPAKYIDRVLLNHVTLSHRHVTTDLLTARYLIMHNFDHIVLRCLVTPLILCLFTEEFQSKMKFKEALLLIFRLFYIVFAINILN